MRIGERVHRSSWDELKSLSVRPAKWPDHNGMNRWFDGYESTRLHDR